MFIVGSATEALSLNLDHQQSNQTESAPEKNESCAPSNGRKRRQSELNERSIEWDNIEKKRRWGSLHDLPTLKSDLSGPEENSILYDLLSGREDCHTAIRRSKLFSNNLHQSHKTTWSSCWANSDRRKRIRPKKCVTKASNSHNDLVPKQSMNQDNSFYIVSKSNDEFIPTTFTNHSIFNQAKPKKQASLQCSKSGWMPSHTTSELEEPLDLSAARNHIDQSAVQDATNDRMINLLFSCCSEKSQSSSYNNKAGESGDAHKAGLAMESIYSPDTIRMHLLPALLMANFRNAIRPKISSNNHHHSKMTGVQPIPADTIPNMSVLTQAVQQLNHFINIKQNSQLKVAQRYSTTKIQDYGYRTNRQPIATDSMTYNQTSMLGQPISPEAWNMNTMSKKKLNTWLDYVRNLVLRPEKYLNSFSNSHHITANGQKSEQEITELGNWFVLRFAANTFEKRVALVRSSWHKLFVIFAQEAGLGILPYICGIAHSNVKDKWLDHTVQQLHELHSLCTRAHLVQSSYHLIRVGLVQPVENGLMAKLEEGILQQSELPYPQLGHFMETQEQRSLALKLAFRILCGLSKEPIEKLFCTPWKLCMDDFFNQLMLE